MGTRQLTLCPSSTNSLEPSPNLVPSEVWASGQHGFVKWGHDAKITKIGVIPTRGWPRQGKANGSLVRRQDLGLISECTTWVWVRAPCGLREIGPPIDHTEGGNWGPKMGSFWLPEMSQNLGCSQLYISTPAWRSDAPFHTRSTLSQTETPMHLTFKALLATWRGDDPNWVHKCQNGKIVHTHFGLAPSRKLLRFAHVVCEPWGPISISPMSYMVHWSKRPACTKVRTWCTAGSKSGKLLEMVKNAHTHGWGK